MDPAWISIFISAVGVGLTYWSVSNTVNKGTVENAKQTGMILQSLDQLKTDMKDLKADNKAISIQISEISTRVTKLEQYTKNDNERLNKLEERIIK